LKIKLKKLVPLKNGVQTTVSSYIISGTDFTSSKVDEPSKAKTVFSVPATVMFSEGS
jgi:hypothetical protein